GSPRKRCGDCPQGSADCPQGSGDCPKRCGKSALPNGKSPQARGRSPLARRKSPLSRGRPALTKGDPSLVRGNSPRPEGSSPRSEGNSPLWTARTALIDRQPATLRGFGKNGYRLPGAQAPSSIPFSLRGEPSRQFGGQPRDLRRAEQTVVVARQGARLDTAERRLAPPVEELWAVGGEGLRGENQGHAPGPGPGHIGPAGPEIHRERGEERPHLGFAEILRRLVARQAGQVAAEPCCQLFVRRRGAGLRCRRRRVDQHDEVQLLPRALELPGHLEGDQSSHGP